MMLTFGIYIVRACRRSALINVGSRHRNMKVHNKSNTPLNTYVLDADADDTGVVFVAVFIVWLLFCLSWLFFVFFRVAGMEQTAFDCAARRKEYYMAARNDCCLPCMAIPNSPLVGVVHSNFVGCFSSHLHFVQTEGRDLRSLILR